MWERAEEDICKLSVDICIFEYSEKIPGLPCYLPDYFGFSEKHTNPFSPWLAAVSSLVRDQKTAVCRTCDFPMNHDCFNLPSLQCVSPDEACTSLDAAMIWTMMQNKKTFTKPLAVIHQADYKGENGGLNLLLIKIPKTHMVKERDDSCKVPLTFICTV